ncbi:MAG: acetyl-CoA/propionyl-CoA carboxylase, biotin carboxylase, biotin carboxyl carrier protein, partial [Chloroflexota bacterium]|nr:acetyl-CoA/propionyl-CoA carboxylase, biotin carboxylase, biotin carboxyl carrier protein [Chloroflexota bacterium]
PLGFGQDDVHIDGHAIEVRLYAEDAENGFLPATGRIERLRWPSGEGVRVDAGVVEGDEVGGRFDPMLAKIIARGDDRADALERLTRALDATVVLGLTTNLRFLRWLVREPVVRDGQARTDALDRVWPPDWAQRARIPDAAWSAAARALLGGVGAGDASTGTADRASVMAAPPQDGFRLNAAPTIRLTSDDETRTVRLAPGSARTRAEIVRAGETVHLDLAGRSIPFRLAPPPDVDRAASAAAAQTGGRAELTAPMPGQVLTIHVGVGSDVEADDPIVTLEAMKMEHVVGSPRAGRVTSLLVAEGDQVTRGDTLGVVDDPTS